MYVELFDRDDRLGSHIFNYIFQILFAHYNNYYIKYSRNNLHYNNSIFVQYLFDYIDEYNKDKIDDNIQFIYPYLKDDFVFFSIYTIKIITSDLFSYFKCNIFNDIKYNQITKKYNVPFNPDKTILIHLRLDDTKGCFDYDGRICSNFFKEHINNDEKNYNILYSFYPTIYYNRQSPLSTEKILNQIEIVSLKYPNYRKIIITNPGEKHEFPYEYIQSEDPSYDLFLLTQCKVVILSRSTFALSSLFFGNHTDVYLPVWGCTSCMGLGTKYNKSNFNYFY
jgi:hypothetical protein